MQQALQLHCNLTVALKVGGTKMDKYDFYDHEKLQELINQRARKYMDYARRWLVAKEKGNDKAKERASKAMRKHRQEDEKFKIMAREAGHYWW
jgi:hypothetical protein